MNELIYQKLYTDTSFHENGIIFADLSHLPHNLRINLCPSDNCSDQATLPEVIFQIIPGTKRQRDVKYKLFFAVACIDYMTLIKNCICSHELQQCTAYNKKISLGHGTRRCVRNLP